MTLRQLLKIFEQFSQRTHSGIKTFSYSDPKKIKEKNIIYPLMVAIPSIQTITDNGIEGKISVLFLDRVSHEDPINVRNVYSNMFEKCKQLKAFFMNNDVDEIELNEDTVFEPVGDHINTDFVSGWGTEINIRLDYDPSICEDELTIENDIIQIGSSSGCECEGGNGLNYIFSASNSNILISTGGTSPQSVSINLNDSIGVSTLSAGQVYGTDISGQNVYSNTGYYLYNSFIDTYENIDERYLRRNTYWASAVTATMFTGTTKKCNVNFSGGEDLFPFGTIYSVQVTGSDAKIFTVENVQSYSFTINSNSTTAPSGKTYWSVFIPKIT